MALSKKPYRGCRDFFPENMRVREYMFNQMRKSAEVFGYEPYDGPLLEEVELYKAKSGEELINDQIYSFTDRGERFVAVRPEMTPTLARMVSNIHRQAAKPIRWYSIPNLMRYEKPQRGRVREHWQYNVDIFGAAENMGELEILSLIKHFLCSFGSTKEMFSILINDRAIVDHLMGSMLSLTDDQSYKLYKIIDRSKKVSGEKLDEMIKEVLADATQQDILKEYLALNSFEGVKEFIGKHEAPAQSFVAFIDKASELGLTEYMQYDPAIVRGLDYYTGIVFEIFDKHPDNNRAIAGGGAYANLLKIFNEEPLGGIGFGLGDVTLRDFLETHKLLPDLSNQSNDLFITTTEESLELNMLTLANQLREDSLRVESSLTKLKFNKIFKIAERKGHSKVGVIENRDGKNQIQIKDLSSGETQFFELNQIEEIKKALNND